MEFSKRVCLALWLVSVACLSPVRAQEAHQPVYNVFSLHNEVSADVDNDLMIATLMVEVEGKDPAVLASKVNASMSWAVNVLRPFGMLKTKTHDYQTYPRYNNGKNRKLVRWQASQSIQIESGDFEAAGKAIQKLQERLQVKGIQLVAKPETRAAATDELIIEALAAFKKRAALIQRNMGASGYRVLDVNVQNELPSYPMFDMAPRYDDMYSAEMAAEPIIEAGTSRVSVQIFGRIQLD